MYKAFITAILLLGLLYPTSSFAQVPSSPGADRNTQKVKSKIQKLGNGDKARISVKLYNATTYKGYVREANDADFVVVDKSGAPHTISYVDVKSIGGQGLSGGAKLAIGIAIGAGAVLAVLGIIVATAP